MMPEPLENKNGITIKQLRQWLEGLPDTHTDADTALTEEPTIWVASGGVSNQVIEVWLSSNGDMILYVRKVNE